MYDGGGTILGDWVGLVLTGSVSALIAGAVLLFRSMQ
jgi:hypothetical protein